MTRVPVFVHAEVLDSADRAARPAVDLVAQEVADRVRALVWARTAGSVSRADTATTLPPSDELADDLYDGRRALRGAVRVVARRGETVPAWRVDRSEEGDTLVADTAGVALLGQALGATAAAQAFFVPDDAIRGDSLAFELRFVRPIVEGPRRVLSPVRVRNPSPAFTLLVPWEQQAAAMSGTILPRYPRGPREMRYEGRVTLRFVVDTNGRAEPQTLRDVWPAGVPRLTGRDHDAYEAFVAASRTAVINGRFYPARVAGCPVRQLVQLPLAWTIGR